MSWDNNVILDAEWTSIPRRWNATGSLSHETIEIGAVKIAADGKTVGTFTRIVKPTLTTRVSRYVNRMTGIDNSAIAVARPLGYVVYELADFIGPGRTRIITWGNCDQVQISRECAFKDIDCGLPTRWLDLQRLYPRIMGTNRKRCVALKEAAEWCGLDFDRAAAHRALYDAEVTAELFKFMASGGCKAQRRAIDTTIRKRTERPCTATIGSLSGEALAALRTSLLAAEAVPSCA